MNTDLIALATILLAAGIYWKLDTLKEWLASNDNDISVKGDGSQDIVELMNQNDKNYLVLYASQTGTAEDYAKRFSKELKTKFGLNVLCCDVETNDFDTLDQLPSNFVVSLFVSTYGEGDFPDGAVLFEQYLQDAHLPDLKFTIFGLGNTTYEFFNSAAKKSLKMLNEAGASFIGELGAGDDGKGTTEEDYLSWKESTFEVLQDHISLNETNNGFKPSFNMELLDEITDDTYLGELTPEYLPGKSGPSTIDAKHPYIAPIVATKELFQENTGRSCIHTEFDISQSNIKYTTGDHVAIWPFNANEKVEQFIATFNLQRDMIFNLTSLDPTMKPLFPCPTTIESTIKYYLEITGPVSREILSVLSEFAPEEIKQYVIDLSKDKDAFAKEITSKQYNLADALLFLSQGKPWSNVPWECLIETIPIITPRYYSISSSSSMDPSTIHVTSMVENNLNESTGTQTLGVTTNLIRNISLVMNNDPVIKTMPVEYDINGPRHLYNRSSLPIHVRHSSFRLPSDPSLPVIMVGPGTGVAPFRGFIRDRVNAVQSDNLGNLGKMMLFYGCRNEDDYLYRDEWPAYSSILDDSFEMIVAFSRITDKKCYVQHKLKERHDDIISLLNQGANIYVCGDAGRMAKDVQNTIAEMIASDKNITIDDANEMIKAMKVNGKYQEDVW